jgi:hypothetical protein
MRRSSNNNVGGGQSSTTTAGTNEGRGIDHNSSQMELQDSEDDNAPVRNSSSTPINFSEETG